MNSKRWAVVVVIDRLGAGFLGPYGNTWLDTPAFNRLAGQSAVFENLLSDSPELQSVYRSYWRGWHAMVEASASEADSLAARLTAAGRSSLLITDETEVANHPLENAFTERIVLPTESRDASCDDMDQTQLADLFSTALESLQDESTPDLVWIHARGMQGAWDAPLVLRNQLADEDDPTPPTLVSPPVKLLARGYDPDEPLGLTHAYGGQIALTDLCLATLLEILDEHPRKEELLLLVTSPRGYPLGEHLRIGPVDHSLYSELLHVPALLRAPSQDIALARDHSLAQPADVFATLLDWFGLPADGASWGKSWLAHLTSTSTDLRPYSAATNGRERAIRTPAWFLRQQVELPELYVKPDDRWEVNNVASRCGEIIEPLQKVLEDFSSSARQNLVPLYEPLEESLSVGLE